MAIATYIFDGTPALSSFYRDTADNMQNVDYDIDEILSYYTTYLQESSVVDRFRMGRPGDGEALCGCIYSLFRKLDWMFGSLRKEMAVVLTTVELDTKIKSRQDIIVRIYNQNENSHPPITEPPRDH